jgi:hypothetical protein
MMIGIHAEHRGEQRKFKRADYTDMLLQTGALLIDSLRKGK